MAAEVPTFLPVRVLEPAAAASIMAVSAPATPSPTAAPNSLIEIELDDGRRVRAGSDVNLVVPRWSGAVGSERHAAMVKVLWSMWAMS